MFIHLYLLKLHSTNVVPRWAERDVTLLYILMMKLITLGIFTTIKIVIC